MFSTLRRAFVPLVLAAAILCPSQARADEAGIAVSGRVVDEHSRSVAGVALRGIASTEISEATSDEHGYFTLSVAEELVSRLAILADDASGDRMGTYRADYDEPPNADSSIEVTLAPCRTLLASVRDANGNPVAGARVGAIIEYARLANATTDSTGRAVLRLPTDVPIQSLYAVKSGLGFDYKVINTPRDPSYQPAWLDGSLVHFRLAEAQTVRIGLSDPDNEPIVGTQVYLWLLNKPGEPDSFNLSFTPQLFRVRTDVNGVAEFRGVPDWTVHPLTFWSSDEQYVRKRIRFDRSKEPDGELTVRLERPVPVRGRVHYADGQPANGIEVSAVGDGYSLDGFRETVTTDDQGRFEVRVAPNLLYMLAVVDQRWAAPVVDGLVVEPNKPVDGLVFVLQRATRIFGRVTVGPHDEPIANQRMNLRQPGRDLHNLEAAELANPENSRRWVQPAVYRGQSTDADGRFEFFVGPGQFVLSGPSQVEAENFEIDDELELEINFTSPRPERGPFAGSVVTEDPRQPVVNAIIDGIYRAGSAGRDLRLRTDQKGQFSGERELHRVVLRAESSDGKMAGIVEIGPDQSHVTIPIGPLASAASRLIDAESGDPLPGHTVNWGRRVPAGDDNAPWRTAWGGATTTDSAGLFEVAGLVPGQEYSLSVPRGDGRSTVLTDFTPETADAIELGDLELKPPYKPPTLEERADRELASEQSPVERYERAVKEAERLRQRVLLIFVKRDAALTKSWFDVRLNDREIRSAFHDYQLVHFDVDSAGVSDLIDRLGVEFGSTELPYAHFVDGSGDELETGSIPRRETGDEIDRDAVAEMVERLAPEPLDARELLNDALAEAAASNRHVIVQETATWCGPCHALSRYLLRHREIWQKDYLWVRIDHRWHGSDEVLDEIKEGDRGGIPWYAILNKDGETLTNSEGPDGNIGFPSQASGINHFISMLQATRQRLTDLELQQLREDLERPAR